MRKTSTIIIAISFVFICCVLPLHKVFAYTTGQAADVVIGQPDMVSGAANQGGSPGANTLTDVYGADTNGTRLVIADYHNNRVLIYNSIPTANNASADIVLGQADFSSVSANRGGLPDANTLYRPDGVVIAHNKLIVSDASNHRILIWNTFPTVNGQPADVVIGQSTMITRNRGLSQTSLYLPAAVAFDDTTGKLVVNDFGNNRVLIYNSIPTTNGASADVVVGQPDMVSGAENQGGTVGPNTLYWPYSARIIQNKLIIADYYNYRVLIYNSIPTTNGASADVVVGQPDMVSGAENQGGTVGPNTLSSPADILYDGSRFFIQDGGNSRILIFNSIPTTNNASANAVIGQTDLFSNGYGTTATTLSYLEGGLATTPECRKLIVVDNYYNNRILIYNNESPCLSPTPTLSPTSTPTSTPTPTPTSSTIAPTSIPPAQPEIPQIPQSDKGNGGGDIVPIKGSDTAGQKITVRIEPETFPFDGYLTSTSYTPTSLQETVTELLTQMTTANTQKTSGDTSPPQSNLTSAGGSILGVTMSTGTAWQVGPVQKIFYKAYPPFGSGKDPAIIIPSLQEKPSNLALSYTDSDLIPPGDPSHPFTPATLKIAYSPDGITWKILQKSVVDPINHSVAVIDTIGGYYMIVSSPSTDTTIPSSPPSRGTSLGVSTEKTTDTPTPVTSAFHTSQTPSPFEDIQINTPSSLTTPSYFQRIIQWIEERVGKATN